VRAAFDAHKIPLLINAEQHASMLGGLGGAFVPLHIFVDSEYAEEASALLEDLREHDRQDAEDLPKEGDGEAEELRAHDAERSARRRRSGIILLIVLGGAATTPYVIGNPLLSVLLVVSCLGAIFLTLHPSKPAPLPRAQVRQSTRK